MQGAGCRVGEMDENAGKLDWLGGGEGIVTGDEAKHGAVDDMDGVNNGLSL